jgi:hypothetical protein
MMVLEISEETRQIIEAPVTISLPKWVWLIITARAKALHSGDNCRYRDNFQKTVSGYASDLFAGTEG